WTLLSVSLWQHRHQLQHAVGQVHRPGRAALYHERRGGGLRLRVLGRGTGGNGRRAREQLLLSQGAQGGRPQGCGHGAGGGAGDLGVQGAEADDEAALQDVGIPRVHGLLHAAVGVYEGSRHAERGGEGREQRVGLRVLLQRLGPSQGLLRADAGYTQATQEQQAVVQ
ncbi:unnamed protein product, partial [Ectocarpus sp. 8 AP-2014]